LLIRIVKGVGVGGVDYPRITWKGGLIKGPRKKKTGGGKKKKGSNAMRSYSFLGRGKDEKRCKMDLMESFKDGTSVCSRTGEERTRPKKKEKVSRFKVAIELEREEPTASIAEKERFAWGRGKAEPA